MNFRAWRAIQSVRRVQQIHQRNIPLRPRSRIHPNSRFIPSQSATNGWYLAVGSGSLVGAASLWQSYTSHYREAQPDIPESQTSSLSPTDALAISLFGMPTEIPPGRPGNLTPEQEEKLREFWAAVLRVFGVFDPATVADGASDAPPNGASPVSAAKKKRHLFRRRKDSDADSQKSGTTSSGPSDISAIGDVDDKHGQGKEFQKALAQQKPEDLRAAFWSMAKHDHPDGLLLRFLRARKWDVNAALVMLVSTMHWRAQEMHVDDDIVLIGEEGELKRAKEASGDAQKDGDGFMQQIRMGKSYLHGIDKQGRPMCFVRVRMHRAGEQSEKSLERFTVFTIETARMLLRPPVDTATIVFDMTDFSMANMDYTPVKFMIKCFEANYPESLGAVLVYKAPWIFSGIWKIIRGWLDPVVAGKVHFCDKVDDLEKFIEKSRIPKECGGNDPYEYKYLDPIVGENSVMKEVEKREALKKDREQMIDRYEDSVLRWISKEIPDAKQALEQRNTIAVELRDNYWALDPFVRAKTIYDRLGVLGAAGSLEFYPAARSKTPPKSVPPEVTTVDDSQSPRASFQTAHETHDDDVD